MTVYLASYKSTHTGLSGLMNRGVRFVTRSQYSHSEICIGNPFESEVWCISASGVDGGVRAKRMQLNPDKWDILPLPHVSEEDATQFLSRNEGDGYDYAGVARFLFPWAIGPSAKRWFCSEAAAAIVGLNEPWRFSPADLHIVVSRYRPE